MFIVSVIFQARPDKIEQFREVILKHASNCLKLETGCRRFDVGVAHDDPAKFIVYEIYDDESAFGVHCTSEHSAWCRSAIRDLLESRDLKTWSLLDNG
jgi:quinol monooxygenase YgiN